MIGIRNQVSRYNGFVQAGLDQETEQFNGKKKQAPVIGAESFIERIGLRIQPHREHPDTPQRALKIGIDAVIKAVTDVFNETEAELFNVPRGRGQGCRARVAALYLSRKAAAKPLS